MSSTDAPEAVPAQVDVDPPDKAKPSSNKPILAILCAAIALVVVFLACLKPGSSDAFLFRVMAGQVISEKGIPATDPFTWTAQGQPLFIDGWLACLFFYAFNSHMTPMSLVLYKGTIPALISLLVLWGALGRSKSWPLSIGAALLTGMALSDWAEVNQQMLTYVIFAALLISLDRYRHGRARLLPYALPVVFALWSNLNSGAVFGLLLIALWVAGESLFGADTAFRQKPLAASLIVSALAIAANPYGFKVYSYELQVLSNYAVINAADPDSHTLRFFEIFLIMTPIALLIAGVKKGWGIGDALMLLAMACAAFLLKRNIAPFIIAAAPVVASALAARLNGSPIPLLNQSGMKMMGAACAVVVLCGLVYVKYPRPDKGSLFKFSFRTGNFPLAGSRHLAVNYPGVLFNDREWGGYLIWKLWPKRQISIDPRPDFFQDRSVYEDSKLIESAGPGWKQALDRMGVQVVLTHKKGKLGKALLVDRNWKMSFYGPVEGLFTRVSAG